MRGRRWPYVAPVDAASTHLAMTPMRKTLILCLALLALGVPAAAHASSSAVIRDCADDGRLQHKYSRGDLEGARKHLPADLDEYSDCRSVINDAIAALGASKKGDGGGGGGGNGGSSRGHASSHKPSAAAKRRQQVSDATALNEATKGHKPTLRIGDKTVKPGSNGLFHLASAANGLPLPLLLALIAVGILALVGGLYALRSRVPALASLPLPRVSLPRVRLPRFRR